MHTHKWNTHTSRFPPALIILSVLYSLLSFYFLPPPCCEDSTIISSPLTFFFILLFSFFRVLSVFFLYCLHTEDNMWMAGWHPSLLFVVVCDLPFLFSCFSLSRTIIISSPICDQELGFGNYWLNNKLPGIIYINDIFFFFLLNCLHHHFFLSSEDERESAFFSERLSTTKLCPHALLCLFSSILVSLSLS